MQGSLRWACTLVVVLVGSDFAGASDDARLFSRCSQLLQAATSGDPVILPNTLYEAQTILIAPGVTDRNLGLGLRSGQGIVLERQADGAWGEPEIVKCSGGSAGFVGHMVTDTIMIFNVPLSAQEALERYRLSSLKVGIGFTAKRGSWRTELDAEGRDPADRVSTYERSQGLVVGAGMELANLSVKKRSSQQSWFSFGSPPPTSEATPESSIDGFSQPTLEVAQLRSTLALVATAPAVEMAALPTAPGGGPSR